MNTNAEPFHVSVDRLQPGNYIRLELKWLEHPFPFSSFKIRDEKQIETLRGLGLKKILYIPDKSDTEPLPRPRPETPGPAAPPSAQDEAALAAKRARMERVAQERQAIQRCEKKYVGAVTTIKNIMRNLFSRPEESAQAAENMMREMVESMLTDRNVAVHLMNDKIAGEDVYYHSLNVAVLAMMLGKEHGLDADEIRILGMGALFHDVGKTRIPDQVLLKTEPLNHAERALYRLHCHLGEEIGGHMGLLPAVIDIIGQHHETVDGKGYPSGLKGERLSTLTKIVSLVNAYDNHCNRISPNDSLTPHEALAHMYAHEREHYDGALLDQFIKCMGIYPPGSIVQLSNEAVGMVISINTEAALRPNVLIYDPTVPKEEAIIFDLQDDPDIKIVQSIRPNLLLREIYEYLSPRRRVTYYFDRPGKNGGAKH